MLQNPQMLWLLPAMILVVLLCRRLKCKSEHMGYRLIPSPHMLSVIHPFTSLLPSGPISSRHQMWRAIGCWLIFFLLVIALADPVRIGARLPETSPPRDVVFIVDTSVGMLLKDYEAQGRPIDRMSLLKAVLLEFAKDLSGDRLSVIVFGDSAHTLVPFTRDEALIRRMLLRIETGMAGRYSAVGDAVAYAVNETTRQSKQRAVLILFTAMSDSLGAVPLDSAARLATQRQLPLYTVAIGSASDSLGKDRQEKSSGLIYEPVNLAALQHLAEYTGATAYHAGNINGLKQAVRDIEQKEAGEGTLPPRYYRQPLYVMPLLMILAILTVLQWAQLFRRRR